MPSLEVPYPLWCDFWRIILVRQNKLVVTVWRVKKDGDSLTIVYIWKQKCLIDLLETIRSSYLNSIAKMEMSNNISSNKSNQSDYYYYYYDYEESVNNIPLEEFIPVAIVYGLTLLLGVIGNVLVIFSISRYRRMQSVTNIFLVSLSSADLILVLICVPIKVSIFIWFVLWDTEWCNGAVIILIWLNKTVKAF